VLDYTPKARRKRSRWRRVVPLLVGVLVVGGSVAVVARTVPAAATGSLPPDPVGVAASLPQSEPARDPSAAPESPSPTAIPTPSPSPTPSPVPTAPPIATLTGYQWPLPNGRLTLPFGPTAWGSRIVDGEKFHDGIDIATFCGDKVVAAHDGVVLAASRKYDTQMGWIGDLKSYFHRLDLNKLWSTLPIVVVIDDGNGYRSVYAHFSKVVVKRGDIVKAGDFLGYEGMTGRASGCHVHYSLFSPLETATFGIDPALVKKMRVPTLQIARIDPLLVLPPRPQDQPSASPGASASGSPGPSPGASPSAGPSVVPGARP
jgi:murein DD-endopeptidase MepM/ murein hydrolase activator NlpD